MPVTGLFVQLTDADIQRLQTAGITIQSGGYFSLPYEVDEIPGEIQFTAQRYTIVKSAVAQGVSVFLIDEKQIGAAEVQDKPTE